MRLGLLRARARYKLWLAFTADIGATTAVEFALVAPLVIALILGAIQIAVIYLAQTELENAAEQAARIVRTKAPASALASQTSFKNAVCGDLAALFTCSDVMVDLQKETVCANASDRLTMTPPTLTYNSSGQVTNTWNYDPGSSGTLEILRVMYQWPIFAGPLGLVFSDLANGTLLLSSTQVFQNERTGTGTQSCS